MSGFKRYFSVDKKIFQFFTAVHPQRDKAIPGSEISHRQRKLQLPGTSNQYLCPDCLTFRKRLCTLFYAQSAAARQRIVPRTFKEQLTACRQRLFVLPGKAQHAILPDNPDAARKSQLTVRPGGKNEFVDGSQVRERYPAQITFDSLQCLPVKTLAQSKRLPAECINICLCP